MVTDKHRRSDVLMMHFYLLRDGGELQDEEERALKKGNERALSGAVRMTLIPSVTHMTRFHL